MTGEKTSSVEKIGLMKMAESSGPNYPSSIVPAGAKFDRFRRNVRNSPISRKLDDAWESVSCRYHFGVSGCTLLSLPSSLPPPHVARYVNVILPKPLVFPIRGTSPARFFVTKRISRLIDEWQEYGIHYAVERVVAVLTYVRGVRSNVLPCLIIR